MRRNDSDRPRAPYMTNGLTSSSRPVIQFKRLSFEDVMLHRLFIAGRGRGFYVDVGADLGTSSHFGNVRVTGLLRVVIKPLRRRKVAAI